MISGTWNPGFQDSSSALELASFDWYQHVGYESHSVYVKELEFQSGIPKFHHSWNLPGIIWNSGIPLEISYFLTISRYRVFFPLNFKLRTWLNAELQNSIIPGNFQKFPGTLDIALELASFDWFQYIGYIFHSILVR